MYTHKKSLGQHFLKDENICRKIIAALQQHSFSQLLEVGPGGGALTKYLVQLEEVDFKAVELDDEKVNFLLKTYPALQGKIIHESFLGMEKPFSGIFAIIGNFPYNISLLEDIVPVNACYTNRLHFFWESALVSAVIFINDVDFRNISLTSPFIKIN